MSGAAASLDAELDALAGLPVAALKGQYERLLGQPAPPTNRPFLERRLAHRMQELAFGGLSVVAKTRLDVLVAGLEGAPAKPKAKQKISRGRGGGQLLPGTRLVRNYLGVNHEVTVLAKGFEYQGVLYPSLTKVAQTISGSHWNGWAFFGLRPKQPGGKP